MGEKTRRTALITGAARGIGRAIAEAFAAADWNLVIADLGASTPDAAVDYELSGPDELTATARALDSIGAGSTIASATDVTLTADCQRAVERARAAFGGLDLLVNNAGIVTSGPIESVSEAAWNRTLDVNTKGAFLMSQAALPAMGDGASIIQIASIAGRSGYPNMVPYCASKFAVVGMTKAMAAELAPRGVRVNAICPGILGTAMWIEHLLDRTGGDVQDESSEARSVRFEALMAEQIPLGRSQTPADIAEAALYLASAHNVTGSVLTVDGGLTPA